MMQLTHYPSRHLKSPIILAGGVLTVFGLFAMCDYAAEYHLKSPLTRLGQYAQVLDIDLELDYEIDAGVEILIEHALDSPLTAHRFMDNGLVEVNPLGQHPIYQLIECAQAEWDDKHARASRTLEEAVAEYQRRYNRSPPRGFDHWWNYVQRHNVQLPDEYDQIHRDLAHFWGVSPTDLQHLERRHEAYWESYVVGKDSESDPVAILDDHLQPELRDQFLGVAQEHIDLLAEVEEFIPPFRAVFSPHDDPNLQTDVRHKKAALDAAAAGTYVDLKTLPKKLDIGWSSGCFFDSPARSDKDHHEPLSSKSFIYDHRLSMDPCLHPSHMRTHGAFTAGHRVPFHTLIPQFSHSTTTLHDDVGLPAPVNWIEDVPSEDNPAWEDRTDERLLWRGRMTGVFYGDGPAQWSQTQRPRLVNIVHEEKGTAQVLPPVAQDIRVGEGVNVPKGKYNSATMDITFLGDEEPDTSTVSGAFSASFGKISCLQAQSLQEAGNYKYVLDIDGNGWSSRFKRLMTTNALVFKSTVYPEWFGDRVQPWVHYIPIKTDYSDLYDAFSFFHGGSKAEGAHEELAKEIGRAGREWSLTMWRKEDLSAYLFRLLLEYARLMSDDRESMSLHL